MVPPILSSRFVSSTAAPSLHSRLLVQADAVVNKNGVTGDASVGGTKKSRPLVDVKAKVGGGSLANVQAKVGGVADVKAKIEGANLANVDATVGGSTVAAVRSRCSVGLGPTSTDEELEKQIKVGGGDGLNVDVPGVLKVRSIRLYVADDATADLLPHQIGGASSDQNNNASKCGGGLVLNLLGICVKAAAKVNALGLGVDADAKVCYSECVHRITLLTPLNRLFFEWMVSWARWLSN